MISKDIIEERLRGAIRVGIGEVRRDPEFITRLVSAVCEELGLDKMVTMYLSAMLKKKFSWGKDA